MAGLAFFAGRALFTCLAFFTGRAFLARFTADLPRALALDLVRFGLGLAFLRGFVRAFGLDLRLAADFLIFLDLRDLDLLLGRFPAMEGSSLETSQTASPMGAY